MWNLDRADTIALRFTPMQQTLSGIDGTVPGGRHDPRPRGRGRLRLSLYGPNLTRRVHTVSSADLGGDRWRNLLRFGDELNAGWILDNGELAVESAPGWTEVVRYTDNGWTLLKRT